MVVLSIGAIHDISASELLPVFHLSAVQWTYFAYLGAIKQQDGAAMSIGRLDAFLDVFIEKDIEAGKITEADAQELIDDLYVPT